MKWNPKALNLQKYLLIITIILHSVNAYSENMRIAVLDFNSTGVSESVANAVTDIIRTDMVNSGLFVVLERAQISEILKEHGLGMAGCTDEECAIQIGKLLSAKKILLGKVVKMGENILITAQIVDVESAISEFAAQAKASSEDDLDTAARSIVVELINRITGNTDGAEFFVKRQVPTGISVSYSQYIPYRINI